MIIGFTGTQVGMTEGQKTELLKQLQSFGPPSWFHHGDCIGADSDAHFIAVRAGYKIAIHPPISSSKRAWREADSMYAVKEYLARNRDIVDACGVLIAAPKHAEEEMRSGTWATVRYARKTRKRIIILDPAGGTL